MDTDKPGGRRKSKTSSHGRGKAGRGAKDDGGGTSWKTCRLYPHCVQPNFCSAVQHDIRNLQGPFIVKVKNIGLNAKEDDVREVAGNHCRIEMGLDRDRSFVAIVVFTSSGECQGLYNSICGGRSKQWKLVPLEKEETLEPWRVCSQCKATNTLPCDGVWCTRCLSKLCEACSKHMATQALNKKVNCPTCKQLLDVNQLSCFIPLNEFHNFKSFFSKALTKHKRQSKSKSAHFQCDLCCRDSNEDNIERGITCNNEEVSVLPVAQLSPQQLELSVCLAIRSVVMLCAKTAFSNG